MPGILEDSASEGEDGPLRYQAPEIYRKESLTTAADVYSFGMICYHLFEAYPPFHTLSPDEAAKAASQGKRPEWGKTNAWGHYVPVEIKDIVRECCNESPSYRPDFQNIVRDLQEVARKMKPSVTERPHDIDDEDDCCSCFGG